MDIALAMTNTAPDQPPAFDIELGGFDLASESGLRTAVLLSLFTDRRAEADDALDDDDRRGWWADAYPSIDRDQFGSRLWLLRREKQMPQVLARAREYAEQALRWLIDDGIATRVTVTAEIVSTGMLGLGIAITLASGGSYDMETTYAI